MEVSPFSRHILDPKLGFLETARELGIAIVVYSPLGRGMLTGQVVSTTCSSLLRTLSSQRAGE